MEQSFRADLNHFHAFYWVAKSGSFTSGAQTIGLPKSSVSRQIAALERRLGVRLLERTTRRLVLTEIGHVFLAHCERVLAEAEQAEHAVTEYTAEARGLLRVGLPVTFARSFLAPLLPAFCQKYPLLKLDLVLRGGALDPLQSLLDVVIHVGRLQDSGYAVRRLGSMPQALFAAKPYLKRHAAPDHPRDLARHAVIMIQRTPRGGRWVLRDPQGAREELWLDPHLAVADPVIACQLTEAGLGIALLPRFLTAPRPHLAPVLPDWRAPEVEFFALHPARRLTPPKVRVFLDFLAAHLNFADAP